MPALWCSEAAKGSRKHICFIVILYFDKNIEIAQAENSAKLGRVFVGNQLKLKRHKLETYIKHDENSLDFWKLNVLCNPLCLCGGFVTECLVNL